MNSCLVKKIKEDLEAWRGRSSFPPQRRLSREQQESVAMKLANTKQTQQRWEVVLSGVMETFPSILLSKSRRNYCQKVVGRGLLRFILGTKEAKSREHISKILIHSESLVHTGEVPTCGCKGQNGGLWCLRQTVHEKFPDAKISPLSKLDILENKP